MSWSFSQSKQFTKCKRQWFFKTKFANAKAVKDPLRREAYILSKLTNIFAWRGKIVDSVISDSIIPRLRSGETLDRKQIMSEAYELFERQLSYALANKIREPNFVASDVEDVFAAFWEIEYDGGVSESLVAEAREDVRLALDNLLEMTSLLNVLRGAHLVAQRQLNFRIEGVSSNIISYPDLIAFFHNQPPLIIDWKVHSFGKIDYRRQLACYALALILTEPHKDFPSSISSYKPTDIKLLEVQLLTNQRREYALTEEDIEDIEDYIATTSLGMEQALIAVEGKKLTPQDFPVTWFPNVCESCAFQKICWELEKWYKEPPKEPKQMSLL